MSQNRNKQKGHSSRNLWSLCLHACLITHVHYAGSGLSIAFSANRNAEQAVPPLFWPVNCIKIGRHVALLSGPSVYIYSVLMCYLWVEICAYSFQYCAFLINIAISLPTVKRYMYYYFKWICFNLQNIKIQLSGKKRRLEFERPSTLVKKPSASHSLRTRPYRHCPIPDLVPHLPPPPPSTSRMS